ncbi:MAG TPA: adenylate/guanylate cyclase domain-containing protein [Acidimicrobiales bacterium]|nr:adenylate/guanylate cyclase domain-containing protein [Acidimicrobiales bacterium]
MRVVRSFAFVDLCGFTHYTASEGDDRATRVLAEFRRTVRDVASGRGVRVAKWLGDGAMIVAVQAGPLVVAVLEIEAGVEDAASLLPIRAGMATGPVILFEGDDYIGTPVNLAARLCDAARPREVLAVPQLAAYCPPWATTGEPHKVPIAGFSAPVEVVSMARRAAPNGSGAPGAGVGSPGVGAAGVGSAGVGSAGVGSAGAGVGSAGAGVGSAGVGSAGAPAAGDGVPAREAAEEPEPDAV